MIAYIAVSGWASQLNSAPSKPSPRRKPWMPRVGFSIQRQTRPVTISEIASG